MIVMNHLNHFILCFFVFCGVDPQLFYFQFLLLNNLIPFHRELSMEEVLLPNRSKVSVSTRFRKYFLYDGRLFVPAGDEENLKSTEESCSGFDDAYFTVTENGKILNKASKTEYFSN